MLKEKICFYILVAGLIAPSAYAHAETEYYFRYIIPKYKSVDENKESNFNKEDLDIVLNLRNYTVGESVGDLVATLTGFKGSPTWSLTGRLPEGMNFGADGQFSGSPMEIGSFTFSLSASSEVENLATKSFSFQVDGSLMFEEQHWVGNVFRQTVADSVMYQSGASGGTSPYTYQVTSGTIPPDYQFRTTQDMFEIYTNIPAPIGHYPFKVRVRDANGITTSADFSIKLEEQGHLKADFPPGYVGVPYTGSFSIAGSTSSNNSITASGDIPGLSWSEGVLSGIPTTPVTNSIVSAVANIDGHTITEDEAVTISHALQITSLGYLSIPENGVIEIVQESEDWNNPRHYPYRNSLDFELGFTYGYGNRSFITFEIIDMIYAPSSFRLDERGKGNMEVKVNGDDDFNPGEPFIFTVRAYDRTVSPPTEGSQDIRTLAIFAYDYVYIGEDIFDHLNNSKSGDYIYYSSPNFKGGKPPYKFSMESYGWGYLAVHMDPDTGDIYGTISAEPGEEFVIVIDVEDDLGVRATRTGTVIIGE